MAATATVTTGVAAGVPAADVPPARVGDALADIDTPALLVDEGYLVANIDTAVAALHGTRVTLRPHAKAVKSPRIAALQIARSGGRTVGVCCQKVVEAEAMVAAGILDVLLSNQVVAPRKIDRLVALAAVPGTRIAVLVDDAANVDALAAAAKGRGVRLYGACACCGTACPCSGFPRVRITTLHPTACPAVLIEVDVGQGRCGVPTAAAAVDLAAHIAGHAPSGSGGGGGLIFDGMQCYHGAAQHCRTVAERRRIGAFSRRPRCGGGCRGRTRVCRGPHRLSAVAGVAAKAREVKAALEAAGQVVATVTGGGTGTFTMEAASGIFTEVQPGSYSVGDADYSRNLDEEGAEMWVSPWRPALFIVSSVMSRRIGATLSAADTWIVLDSGLKAQSTDSGPPVFVATVAQFVAAQAAVMGDTAGGSAAIATAGPAAASGEARATPVAVARHPFAFPAFEGPRPGAAAIGGAAAGWAVKGVSDEHTVLIPTPGTLPSAAAVPALGTPCLLFPGHCDPTVNHFDWLVFVRDGRVTAVERLAARSPGV